MKDWDFAIKNIVKDDLRSSFATRANRAQMLSQFGQQLRELGYKLNHPRGLKQKHILALIEQWKKEEKPAATIKNRISNLRWLVSQKTVNREKIIPPKNAELGIENRVYLKNDEQKAFQILPGHLEAIKDEALKASLLLQKEFGLRREEALKIRPWSADKGEHLHLQASWCKGGRERNIPIRTAAQRQALDMAKKIAESIGGRHGSLIPKELSYKEHMKHYEKQTLAAGIHGHGIRHQYAQDRFKNLTGLDCPKAGGLTWKELTTEQQKIVRTARLTIASELGHGREIIANNYLGK